MSPALGSGSGGNGGSPARRKASSASSHTSRSDRASIGPNATFGVVENPAKIGWRKYVSKRGLLLVFWATLAIVSGVGQTLYLGLSLGVAMPQYPFWVFWTTAIIFLAVFAVVLAGFQLFTTQITRSMRSVSHMKWATIGFLTAINGACLLFAGPHIPGQEQALLGPTVVIVPMCMIASYLYLGQRYSYGQMFGVFVILAGIVVALLPKLTGKGQSSSGPKGSIWWDLLWTLGSSPSAFMAVYEEKAFAEQPIHMAHLMAWSTLYQLITIFVVGAPLSIIPGFGNSAPRDFWSHQSDAFLCFATGKNPSSCPECDCSLAVSFVMLFTLNYILTNYAQLGVVKYGNATFSFIVATVVTPLSFFAFSSPFLTGGNTEELHSLAIVALVVLVVGVVIYRYFDVQAIDEHSPTAAIESLPGGFSSLNFDSPEASVTVLTHSLSAYGFAPFRATKRSLAAHHAKTFSGGYEPLIQKDLGFLGPATLADSTSFFTS